MIKEKDILSEINCLEKSLERISAEIEILKKEFPEGGRLRAVRHGKGHQFFLRRSGERSNGEYIKKKDIRKAEMLAQIEYDEKLVTVFQQAIESFKKCKAAGTDSIFEEVLQSMAPGKRELVVKPYISDQCYLENWMAQEYTGLGFREGNPEFYTRKGLRVRSKSEVIIADMLDELNVPFLYEKPLCLKHGTIYPDFTLLNIKERKEVYWEHFGMMDDREYRDDALMKIREYEENDLFQYDSVIWTFETGKNPLNTRELRKMIKILRTRLMS
ncbi:MAG: hypothetical protein IKR23_00890 [Lachnospiraceae bacterium]|nr:hypothetical protein [Lachnospiraceae bacterium]